MRRVGKAPRILHLRVDVSEDKALVKSLVWAWCSWIYFNEE